MATIAERAERGGGESIAGSSPSSGRQEGHGRNQVEKQTGQRLGLRRHAEAARGCVASGGQHMLCVSGQKISELGFSGVRHRSGKVLKNGNAGTTRLESAVKTDPSGLKNVGSSEF